MDSIACFTIETEGQKDHYFDTISKQHGDVMPSTCHSEEILWNPSNTECNPVSSPHSCYTGSVHSICIHTVDVTITTVQHCCTDGASCASGS